MEAGEGLNLVVNPARVAELQSVVMIQTLQNNIVKVLTAGGFIKVFASNS